MDLKLLETGAKKQIIIIALNDGRNIIAVCNFWWFWDAKYKKLPM